MGGDNTFGLVRWLQNYDGSAADWLRSPVTHHLIDTFSLSTPVAVRKQGTNVLVAIKNYNLNYLVLLGMTSHCHFMG